jgi:hypothetical protein
MRKKKCIEMADSIVKANEKIEYLKKERKRLKHSLEENFLYICLNSYERNRAREPFHLHVGIERFYEIMALDEEIKRLVRDTVLSRIDKKIEYAEEKLDELLKED